MQDFGYEFLQALGMTEVPVVHIMMTSPASWLSTQFCLHSAMLAWVLAVALCLSQVGVLSKGMNGLIWFLAWRLLSTSPALSCELCLLEQHAVTQHAVTRVN